MEENYGDIVTEVHYNITNEEDGKAFTLFQKRYIYKTNLIKSVLFAALGVIFITQIMKNPSYTMGWLCAGISFAFVAITWIAPYNAKKKLLAALKELEDNRYIVKFYHHCFSVELIQDDVIVKAEEAKTENTSDDEKQEDTDVSQQDTENEIPEKIPPRIINYSQDKVEVTETDELFAIFLKKQTIYTLPKRCLEQYQCEELSRYFSEELKEKYKRIVR